MSAAERVRAALIDAGCKREKPGAWTCPAHDDKRASLSVNPGEDGRVLLHCHAGCSTEAVTTALGLSAVDLFEETASARPSIVAAYPYVDEAGELLYEVVRFAPKDFRQRRPDGSGGWVWNLGDTRRVVYRLPEVLAAVAAGQTIYVAEGEKDVHAIEAAGAVATCNSGGAKKWRSEYAAHLRGAEVVIVADCDEPGRTHAAEVARSLTGVAASVRVVEAAEGKDAADHLAAGHALDDFTDQPREGADADQAPTAAAAAEAWQRLDLAAFLRDPPPKPDWLLEGFVEHGELVWLAGPGKVGKSMVALFVACAALAGAGTFLGAPLDRLDWLLYVDGENSESSVRRRVHLAGVPIGVAGRIDYRAVRGVDLGAAEHLEVLADLADRPGRGLVILDSLVALHRADEDKAGEVRAFVTGLRAVAESAGVTMIGLAHENRGGNMRGSLDWRNAVDTVLEVRKDETGLRTLKIGDRRNGAEDLAPRVFRFVERGGQLLIEATETTTPRRGGRPPTRVMDLTERVIEMRRGDREISQAETARRLKIRPDHGTFREAWRQAGSALAAETARAEGPGLPGRQGTPPIGGAACLPASTPAAAVHLFEQSNDPDDPNGRPVAPAVAGASE